MTGWPNGYIVLLTCKQKVMGSNPAWVEKIFGLLVHHTQCALVEYEVDREAIGDRQRHQVCMGDP